MTKEAEVGDRFTGKVVKTTTFGAFVELAKGTDGLLHISNVKPGERAESVEDVLNQGDELDVTRGRGRQGARPDRPAALRRPVGRGQVAPRSCANVGTGDRGPRRGGGRDGGARRPRAARRRRRGRDAAAEQRQPAASADGAARGRRAHRARLGRLRVITEAVPSVRSVALGLWVRTGSRDETPAQAGVSHFLEHLLFKGTERHSAIEISELFDGMGAAANAATSKESTAPPRALPGRAHRGGFRAPCRHAARALAAPDEVDSERDVVLEEIAMYEDEPQDRVHDVLAEAMYGDHPLGRRVLGDAEVIASIPVAEIAAYHGAALHGPEPRGRRGGPSRPRRDRRAGPAPVESSDAPSDQDRPAARARRRAAVRASRPKDTEQYHICFGGPGIARGDERRFALSVLDAVFGGSTSSRLFREVREKRGLAYAVGSYTEQYTDRGRGRDVRRHPRGQRRRGLRDHRPRAGRACATTGSAPTELERAKEHVKGRMVLALEATGARMTRLARAALFDAPLLSLDEMFARVEAVSRDDVAELAAELYDPERLSAACIGPQTGPLPRRHRLGEPGAGRGLEQLRGMLRYRVRCRRVRVQAWRQALPHLPRLRR